MDFIKSTGSSKCIAPLSQMARVGLGTHCSVWFNAGRSTVGVHLACAGFVVPIVSFFHLLLIFVAHKLSVRFCGNVGCCVRFLEVACGNALSAAPRDRGASRSALDRMK
jgi:hypothetical protein